MRNREEKYFVTK